MNIQEPTSHINYKNLSFFEYEEPDEFGEFDAVVGNPPYIRGNQLKKMGVLDSFRDHLREYNPDGNKKPEYYSGTKKFRNDTDSFIYFITNSLRYLREGGRMGMIVPAKWMETQYGAKFQQFLFDNTKIHSVITFSNRVFDDAKVKSSVLLLEKCSDATKRANSTVNFIQVNNTLNPEDILPAIDYNPELETVYELTQMDGFSICSIQQDDLKSRPKWSYLYRAPERVIELIENSEFKTLSDFAKVTSGTKSGANPFFHLDEDDIKQHGVNRQFLRPLIKSIRDCSEEDPVFLEEDTDKYILDINWYVNMNNLSSYDELLNQLETDGYSNLRDYLEYGKSKGYDDRPSTSSRKIWCSIPSMDVPAVIQPTFINERSFVVSNIDELPINDSLSGIQFNDDIEFEIGIALLNTYLYKMLLELWGKTEGDGVLQLKTYDIESVPFPDIDKLGETEKELLRKSYENVKKGEYDGLADKVILDMLDIDDITVREIEKVYDSLESARLEGVESEVLLNREESSGSEFEEMNLEEFM